MAARPYLCILRGAPAVGKTAISKKMLSKMQGKVSRICIDDIQHFDLRAGSGKDKLQLGVYHAALLTGSFLSNGFSVLVEYIFDEHLQYFVDNVVLHRAKGTAFDLQVIFLEASLKTLQKRNVARADPMPLDILEKLHKKVCATKQLDFTEVCIATDAAGATPKTLAGDILKITDGIIHFD